MKIHDADLKGGLTADKYDAYSILAADVDNSPVAVTLPMRSIVGRSEAGIVSISFAENSILIRNSAGIENFAFATYSVLVRNDSGFQNLTLSASTVLGRKSTGGIVELSGSDLNTIMGGLAHQQNTDTGTSSRTFQFFNANGGPKVSAAYGGRRIDIINENGSSNIYVGFQYLCLRNPADTFESVLTATGITSSQMWTMPNVASGGVLLGDTLVSGSAITGTTSQTFQFWSGNNGCVFFQNGVNGSNQNELRNYNNSAKAVLTVGALHAYGETTDAGSVVFHTSNKLIMAALQYTGSSNRTFYLPDNAGTYILSDASTIPGARISGNISGYAANITGNLPGSQVTGNISGNAASITGTVAGSQVTGNIPGNSASITGTITSSQVTGTIPGSQISGDISGNAASITGTITGGQVSGNISGYAANITGNLPGSQVSGNIPGNAVSITGTVAGSQVTGNIPGNAVSITGTVQGAQVSGNISGNAATATTVTSGALKSVTYASYGRIDKVLEPLNLIWNATPTTSSGIEIFTLSYTVARNCTASFIINVPLLSIGNRHAFLAFFWDNVCYGVSTDYCPAWWGKSISLVTPPYSVTAGAHVMKVRLGTTIHASEGPGANYVNAGFISVTLMGGVDFTFGGGTAIPTCTVTVSEFA